MSRDRTGRCRLHVTLPRVLWIAVFISLSLFACMLPQAGANVLDGGVEPYDPDVDYFPEQVRVQYATGFAVRYHPHYKVVTVRNPWRQAQQTFQYVLVQRGAPAPAGYPQAQRIQVPVRTLVTMSTTYLPYLDMFGMADRLVGHSGLGQVNTPAIVKRIEAGKVVEIGSGAGINIELLLDVHPDLIMTHAVGSPQHDAHPKLLEAGLNVALNAAYMDTSPLGRTEWMKFIALFFNQEAAAERLFDDIAAAYKRLAHLARSVRIKPTVFTQADYQGTWYMPGGNSYMARFLQDAGATYLWADDRSAGNIGLDFESVFARASAADFWLVNWSGWERLRDVMAADERYANFAALQRGRVYNNNARLNPHGGNDYWETGVAHPHRVLADLIRIFHPDLLPDHKLIWYRPLKGE